MLRRPRILVPLAALALLAAYVVLLPPKRALGTYLSRCPMSLAGFPGRQLGLEKAVLDDLNPDDYLVRVFARPDSVPVWLVIVYFQNARLGAHDPQICYRSQGFRVQPLPAVSVETTVGNVPAEAFLAVKGSRKELVDYFWYTAGGQMLSEVKTWRDRMFLQGVKRNRSFGAFVRVSTLEGENPNVAPGVLRSVIQDLAPRLPTFFPEKVGG